MTKIAPFPGQIGLATIRGVRQRVQVVRPDPPSNIVRPGCWIVRLEDGDVWSLHQSRIEPYRPKGVAP